jgi:hypothetical protein
MTVNSLRILPKFFPTKVDFYWLENKIELFDDGVFRILKRNIFLLNGRGVILGKNLFPKTSYGKLNFITELKRFLKKTLNTKIITENNIYILVDIWSTGPYHFYVDMLSKVLRLTEQLDLNLKITKILVFDDTFTNNVIIPLLKDLGIGNIKVLKLKSTDQYVILGRNHYVTKPHIIGTNNPAVIPKVYDLIQKSLLKYIPTQESKRYNGVYYFRTGRYRKVVNDELIIKKLKNLGFYCTSFEELSYIEAFILMQQTRLFIGIHGGGLTNMVFLPPASVVIEIKNDNPNPESHCYWHLARSLNFDYTMFVAETVGDDRIVEGKGCDLRVDWKILNHLLDELI